MERLYALGETACTGVHGKNRLASNSLLESLVFSRRAAMDISRTFSHAPLPSDADLCCCVNPDTVEDEYKKLVLEYVEQDKQLKDMKGHKYV